MKRSKSLICCIKLFIFSEVLVFAICTLSQLAVTAFEQPGKNKSLDITNSIQQIEIPKPHIDKVGRKERLVYKNLENHRSNSNEETFSNIEEELFNNESALLHEINYPSPKSERQLQEESEKNPTTNNENENQEDNVEDLDPNEDDKIADIEYSKPINQRPVFADGNTRNYDLDTCDVLILPLNYHKIDVQIKILGNIHRFMLTDKKMDSCRSLEEFECPIGSRICSIQQVSKDRKVYLSLGDCVKEQYLYVRQYNSTINSNLELSASFVNNTACGTPSLTDPYLKCGSIDAEICKDYSACLSDCVWLDCRVGQGEAFRSVYGVCVPTNIPEDNQNRICKSYTDYFHSHNKSVDLDQCTPERKMQVQKSILWVYIVLTIFGSIVIIFGMCACYYQYQLNLYKMPPFEPPGYCPDICFPRTYVPLPEEDKKSIIELDGSVYLKNSNRCL